ncbi:hypothetical protein D9M71_302530 [compost metagenome]
MQGLADRVLRQLVFQERQRMHAQHLALQVADGLADLRTLDLQDRAFRARHPAALHRRQDAQRAHLDGHQLHFHFGDLHPQQRVLDQGAAIALLRRGDPLELGQGRLGMGDSGLAGALVGEQVLGAGPALVLFAHAVGHRHLHIVEEHLVDFVIAVEGDDRPHADAGRGHVDQQEGNAALLLRLGVGAHQAEDPVGVLAEGGPGLLAVDHVVVTLAHRAGLQRGQVGTGARLGVALAPPVAAVEDARQVAGLLLGSAELDDHRRDHVDAEGDQPRRTEGGALLLEDVLLHHAPAGAAVFHRPVGGIPAAGIEDALPALVVGLAEVLAEAHPLGDVRGQFGAQELAYLVAEGELFRAVVDVHGDSSIDGGGAALGDWDQAAD